MTRDELVAVVADLARGADCAVFAGNGSVVRSFATLEDEPRHFYMVGSMGLCSSIAAGFANRSNVPVIAVEGDGNVLMGLSGLPTIVAATAGRTFVHVVADNGCCETTGGQLTLSPNVDFITLATAVGYDNSISVSDPENLRAALEGSLAGGKRTLVHAAVVAGTSPKHPRPTLEPTAIAHRFSEHVALSVPNAVALGVRRA